MMIDFLLLWFGSGLISVILFRLEAGKMEIANLLLCIIAGPFWLIGRSIVLIITLFFEKLPKFLRKRI